MKKIIITLCISIISTFFYNVNGQSLKKIDSLLKNKSILKETIVKDQNNFSLTTLYTSNYIWRDAISNYAAIQPSATYTFGKSGFSMNFWSSFGANYETSDLEISTTLNYNFSVTKQVNANFGLIHYIAPILSDGVNYFLGTNFSEFFIGINFPNFLQTNLNVFITDAGVIYQNISFGQNIPVFKNHVLTVNSSLGYRINETFNTNGFRDFNFTISMPLKFKYINLVLFSSFTHVIKPNINTYQVGINFVFQ